MQRRSGGYGNIASCDPWARPDGSRCHVAADGVVRAPGLGRGTRTMRRTDEEARHRCGSGGQRVRDRSKVAAVSTPTGIPRLATQNPPVKSPSPQRPRARWASSRVGGHWQSRHSRAHDCREAGQCLRCGRPTSRTVRHHVVVWIPIDVTRSPPEASSTSGRWRTAAPTGSRRAHLRCSPDDLGLASIPPKAMEPSDPANGCRCP